jgi:hypothetical protein
MNATQVRNISGLLYFAAVLRADFTIFLQRGGNVFSRYVE